jgi:hypothetical protein
MRLSRLSNPFPTLLRARLAAAIAASACALLLSACGGSSDPGSSPFGSGAGTATGGGSTGGATTGGGTGGGTTGGSGTPVSTLAIGLSLSSDVVTIAAPATVTARLVNRNGPIAGAVVTFVTTNNLGSFTPNAGTALTDANGTAVVTLRPTASDASGAAEVTATASVNGEVVRATSGFQFTATNVQIASFVSGIGSSTLPPYGQAVPTVTIAGTAPGTPVTVALNSPCIASGKARISPATLTTSTGTASFSYTDNGCGAIQASDSITASIVNSAATSQLNLPIASPAASSLTFVSATPPIIYLRGSSLVENSTVVFELRDQGGNALPNRQVTLELSTFAGGLTLDDAQQPVVKTSNAQGKVEVGVKSGTVPTPVRVRASLAATAGNPAISTVSNELTVAVGLPAQANFGLAQATINIEGYDYIDTANTYTVIASDRSGNPVPAGTAINFTTEGGQVQASRTIASTPAGIARADASFVSALPRPLDGRVTIVAYALGEESFKDLNGNNVYDPGEPFQDLGDVYRDRLFDGVFDPANDEFVSLQLPGSVPRAACVNSNEPELRLDVTVPSRATTTTPTPTCDGIWGPAYVRRATETVLSTSAARPVWGLVPPVGVSPGGAINLQLGSTAASVASLPTVSGSSISGFGARGSFGFFATDANSVRLNPVAAGTTITAEASNGVTVKVVGGSPVVSTSNPFSTGVGIEYEFDTSTSAGRITVRMTSPRQVTTTFGVNVAR